MITKLDDYIDKIQDKWPDIPRKELQEIVKIGFQNLTHIVKTGGRVIVNPGWYYTIIKDVIHSESHHNIAYGQHKLRYEYKKLGGEFDGYYYFGISKEQYKRYLKNSSKRHVFKNVKLHKIKDEAYLVMSHEYFFKTPYLDDVGFSMYKKVFRPSKVELIAHRDEQKHIIELNGK